MGIAATVQAADAAPPDRNHLPIQLPAPARVSAPAHAPVPIFPQPVVAPKGAPNILIVMTDDVGFGASSTFGGPVPTPTVDMLAKSGLRYNNFRTNAVCSPTRAALLTGRHAHDVGFGNVSEMSMGYPGYNSVMPRSAATFARVLRDNGYGTAMFGKHHNVPEWQTGRAGPFDQWPTGLGFEYFYGFLGGATNQFYPALIENTVPRQPPADDPSYILDRDLADRAIAWLRQQAVSASGRPFLLYMAPASAHSPHQAPADWIARFKGRFDQGWDKVREETFARQRRMGIIPAHARLTPRPEGIPAWDGLDAKGREVGARMMEVFAAQLAYSDFQVGRVIEELRQLGVYDNTLIIFIQGDNGGSPEGGVNGTTDQSMAYSGRYQSIGELHADLDRMGGPLTEENYPVGWAWAMNTPFQYTKQIAGYRGGNSNGMVLSWPGHVPDPGAVRGQFQSVMDIAPTLYEAAGIPAPESVDGFEQMPIAGRSLLDTVASAMAPGRRDGQIFEVIGNYGIHAQGWEATVRPRALPWLERVSRGEQAVHWELYHVAQDFSQSRDVSARYPEKLKELQDLFEAQARAHNLHPISTASMERMNAAGRPNPLAGRSTFALSGMQARLGRAEFPRLLNRSWSLSAEVDISGAEGMIVNQGGRFGGWALMLLDGRPTFIYKPSANPAETLRIAGAAPLPAGRHRIDVRFAYDGGGVGRGGLFSLSVDGAPIGERRIEKTMPFIVGEAADVGADSGTPLVDEYTLPFALDGHVARVEIRFDE
ncbi:MAG: arylsulfatase [Gammaproteobacteria bacterium]